MEDARSLSAAARAARRATAALARVDPNEFCAFVLRDERTGKPIDQAPMHEEWHELASLYDRLVIWSHVEGGKTNQLPIGRVLWELGRDPTLRIAVISNTAELARKITRQIGQYIEKSAELHDVFPDLLPTDDPALPWKAQALTVRRPGVGGKDPSIQAAGVHGNIIGSRVDLLVIDDILDPENTRTPGPREDVWRWIKSALFSRLTERARVIIVGNAWHPDDCMHKLEKEPGFRGFRFPVVDKAGRVTWPSRWPKKRIEKARHDLGPLEFARQLLCQARDDDSSMFKREWLEGCLAKGDGLKTYKTAEEFLVDEYGVDASRARETAIRLGGADGWLFKFYTGVDIAVQRGESNHLTVFFTICVYENGERRVLNIESGKWSGPEIVAKIEDHDVRYGSIQMVENVAAQDFILQFARERSAATVRPFTTGKNKANPVFGVQSLAAEFAADKWVIPNKGGHLEPELHDWVQEVLFYEPPPAHTGDRLMASWFAREGARYGEHGRGRGEVSVRCF